MTALKTMAAILAETEDPAWIFAVDGFEPQHPLPGFCRGALSCGVTP